MTRLTPQKGVELIRQGAGDILAAGGFFIALGSGENDSERFLQALRDYAPSRVGVYIGYNERLAHLIEAGADMFLMPSRFEPCGLNQMYSLRYGTVPIVRAVGCGLDDTVQNWDAVSATGNGGPNVCSFLTSYWRRSTRPVLLMRTSRRGKRYSATGWRSITRGRTLRGNMSNCITGRWPIDN